MNKTAIKILSFMVCFVLMAGCSSAPRYGTQNIPKKSSPPKSTQTVPSKQIPVEKNYELSYQRSWIGLCSWYGEDFHGKKTASGEIYNMYDLTAAHRTLPLGTKVRVTNLENNRSVILTINDRGPYIEGRILDVSYAAAKALGFEHMGTTRVHIQVISFGDNTNVK
ncbi:MAG: septal ring lytic transglycosylase RlpA family protein [Candidatus Marinimicrobia bacterium]|nr:septal ring lytic transglycosylase RlpA family protein [Candidatus Neomarinimicrobiota bacterium]MDD5583042.1 septal ring lytic transglycosylase RlpA family protein [Candidatus Neomarinimicrobiota bacterium]